MMKFFNHMVDIIKVFWIYFWIITETIVFFFPIVITALFSSTGNLAFNLCRFWCLMMIKLTGVTVTVRNIEKIKQGQSYIIISNHQSQSDILALITSLKIQFRWIIKKEILKIPLFGYALYASRNIFIDRSNRGKSIESINKGISRLPEDVSVMIFVEGTRSSDGNIQKFKKGGFVAAIKSGLPVLPITVNGSRRVMPKGSLAFNPGPIEIIVGDAIKTTDFTTDKLQELVDKTRDIVVSNFNPQYPLV